MSSNKSTRLLLVDFAAGIAGIEDTVGVGIHSFLRITYDRAKPGEFRGVTDTLPKRGGGWNPRGFRGGTWNWSAIGLLAVVEAIMRRNISESDLHHVVEIKSAQYVIKPCRADMMPRRLWERSNSRGGASTPLLAAYHRYIRRFPRGVDFGRFQGMAWSAEKRRQEVQMFQLQQAVRRRCFALKNEPRPARTYFAKGTCYALPPANAVGRLGDSGSSTIVFLDKFARPIEAWTGCHSGPKAWAERISIPQELNWAAFAPLGKNAVDRLFGVAA